MLSFQLQISKELGNLVSMTDSRLPTFNLSDKQKSVSVSQSNQIHLSVVSLVQFLILIASQTVQSFLLFPQNDRPQP